jgi:DNA polymerase beta
VRTARLAAARHGMYLDEYGLWRWHSSDEAALESQSDADDHTNAGPEIQPNATTAGTESEVVVAGYWELVEGESEERILDELELGMISPHRRNFRFLSNRRRASARAGTLELGLAVPEEDGDDETEESVGESSLATQRSKN